MTRRRLSHGCQAGCGRGWRGRRLSGRKKLSGERVSRTPLMKMVIVIRSGDLMGSFMILIILPHHI
jgi:hypothetical protein